jgi:hypothetical protein
MINEILWYIWMVGRAYLGAGIVFALISMVMYYKSYEKFTWESFICIVLFHPIVVYYFIKELNK